jgi:hypothetical protein
MGEIIDGGGGERRLRAVEELCVSVFGFIKSLIVSSQNSIRRGKKNILECVADYLMWLIMSNVNESKYLHKH